MQIRKYSAIGAIALGIVATLGLSGCVAVQEVPPHRAPHPQPAAVQIRTMPEVIVEERSPPPAPNWHWVNGYWKWEYNRWNWHPGRWVATAVPPMPKPIIEQWGPPPSPRHYWVPGHWIWHPEMNNWFWVNGRWYS